MSHDPETLYTNTRAIDALVPLTDGLRFAALKTGGAVSLSRYLAHDFPRAVRAAEEAIADALPALTEADFYKACNGDNTLRAEVERFRDGRWSLVDVSDLRGTGDDDENGDTWSILRGSSRFEVREVPRYEARRVGGAGQVEGWIVWDNFDNSEATDDVIADTYPDAEVLGEEQARALAETMSGETVYLVWDTDNDEDPRTVHNRHDDAHERACDYDPTDEGSAREAAEAANVSDYQARANGWPFAWNYAAAIDERDADDFAAAGFVVARHEPSGQVYAGIDGGGYDFLEAHWSRVYLAFRLHGNYSPETFYVPTRDGLRRVVRGA